MGNPGFIVAVAGLVSILSLAIGLAVGWSTNLDRILGRETGESPPQSHELLLKHVESIHQFLDAKLQEIKSEPQIGSRIDLESYRAFIASHLGVPPECSGSGNDVVLEEIDATGISGRLYSITGTVCDGALPTSGLFALPAPGGSRAPLVLAVHGTAASPELIFGLENADGFTNSDYHNLLAERLLQSGFAVYAPRIVTDWTVRENSVFNRDRNALHRRSASMGHSLAGIEVGILSDTLSELLDHPGVDEDHVGLYGISLGGFTAFYLAALDTRIDATVISQWLEPRADKLISRDHPDSMWRYEHGDYTQLDEAARHLQDRNVAALIAPRALFIEAGADDHPRTGFTLDLWPVLLELWGDDAATRGYLCLDVHPGGHEVHFVNAERFLQAMLSAERDVPASTSRSAPSFCPQPERQ